MSEQQRSRPANLNEVMGRAQRGEHSAARLGPAGCGGAAIMILVS